MSILGWVQLTNVARYYSPFELFLTWSPAQRSFLNDLSIMKASGVTGNRKGKRIPKYFLIAVSFLFRHNEYMKIEIPDTTIQALKNALLEDHNKEVNQQDLERKINDLISDWVSDLAVWED